MMKKDRIQLVHRFYGPEDKPLILFLHGFMGSGRDWEKVISLLSEHYRCLSLDLPGHGESAQLNRHLNWNMKTTADGVCQLLNNTGIRKCYMVGYSMGGRRVSNMINALRFNWKAAILNTFSASGFGSLCSGE
jgi:2-succinyl-6-hydroxy-2,4-cyclohexadiene-1-carboxylate synthase